jgi:hypothetical protein
MIHLPDDVVAWLMGVFRTCNAEASSKLTRVPNAHEPWIDFAVIENLQRVSVPFRFRSEWIVSIDTHWLGSAPMWPDARPRWEIADIGFLVMFRTATKLVRSKVALLQSKRLYADRGRPESPEELERYYRRGFGRMFATDEQFAEMTHPKLFRFDAASEYSALKKGSDQWQAVEEYEKAKQIPVYYLLYNPLSVPMDIAVPHTDGFADAGPCDAGCRVVPCRFVQRMMKSREDGDSPSYGDLATNLGTPFDTDSHKTGWRLEHFVVELLLQCKTGRVTDIRDDQGLYQVFYRRTAPIRAAIAITIDAPAGVDWAIEGQ